MNNVYEFEYYNKDNETENLEEAEYESLTLDEALISFRNDFPFSLGWRIRSVNEIVDR